MRLHFGIEQRGGFESCAIISLGTHAFVCFVRPYYPPFAGRYGGRSFRIGRRVLVVQKERIRYYHCADCGVEIRDPSFDLQDWDACFLCTACDRKSSEEYFRELNLRPVQELEDF